MADSAGKSESSDNEVEDNLNDPCEPSDAGTVREDGGPVGGKSDSKAETNQSDAGTKKDLCEYFKELNTNPDQSDAEQETAHGSETPKQKRDSGVESQRKGKLLKNVKRELLPDANQSKKGTEKTDELAERKDGKWLEVHPWQSKTPNSKESTGKTVCK